MVPNTASVSGSTENSSRLRATCRRTSRNASSAPRRSNLLMTTASAKSSMSIFSSCEEAPDQLVGQRGLAGSAGAGDAQHRNGAPLGGGVQLGNQVVVGRAAFEDGDETGQCPPIAGQHRREVGRRC